MIKKFFILNLLLVFLIVQIVIPAINSSNLLFAKTQDQNQCNKILDKAQELYYEGRFTESFNLVKSCLTDTNISNENRLKAYKILSQVALARDNENQAKEIIRQILKLDPQYRPTIEQEPPKFVQLVDTVRNEEEQKIATSESTNLKSEKSYWPWYAAGAAVAGTALYFILKSDDSAKKDEPLSLPPAWPENK